jgi:Uma2 family endonuclease
MTIADAIPAVPPAYRPSAGREPMWDVLQLFPGRGEWTEADYFALNTNRLVELVAGSIEVLPMPTELHQNIAWFLCTLLKAFIKADEQAMALMSPFSIRLWPGHIRQPDVVYMAGRNAHRRHGNVWDGADLAVEVVSEDDPNRDLRVKRAEYAVARIPEYWIIDPRPQTVTVLRLDGDQYAVAGTYAPGDTAASVLLPGFTVDVSDIFNAR